MLRRKDDMKEWQKDALPQDCIQGIIAPDGLPCDDAPEVPEEIITEVKPKRKPSTKRKKAEAKAE